MYNNKPCGNTQKPQSALSNCLQNWKKKLSVSLQSTGRIKDIKVLSVCNICCLKCHYKMQSKGEQSKSRQDQEDEENFHVTALELSGTHRYSSALHIQQGRMDW